MKTKKINNWHNFLQVQDSIYTFLQMARFIWAENFHMGNFPRVSFSYEG